MKIALIRPLALAALLMPVLAHAHPGHDGDHDFGWDFGHLVTNPWATFACVACVAGLGWGAWRMLKPSARRSSQPVKRD